MLFLIFQLGKDRYALDTRRVVEVLPLVALKRLPEAPRGVAGLFIYHGVPVPALDLSQLALGAPARERLSTRIIIVDCPNSRGQSRLLGLIAENATDTLRQDPNDFRQPEANLSAAPYLGPVLAHADGPIQWIREQHLLPEPVRDQLFLAASASAA